jgi:uncharacterized membrane protein YgdD (TMEM256/DUF423 family)
MQQLFTLFGSLSAGAAVALGAFGAHALKARLSAERQETFETGVRYQMYHALGLLAVALAINLWPAPVLSEIAGWLFVAGTLLFSGSLYMLVFSGNRRWGAVTPLGGIAFVAGWICLALAAV